MDITELLAFGVKNGASDLHLSAGLPPMIRVDGDVRRINLPPMDHKQVHGLIYDIMNDKQRKDFEEFLETDFSFEVPGVARFRVNAFNQNRGAGAVFRTIPSKVLSMEDLGQGQVFKDICEFPRGIVLVTGPTGSGKTTTLYSTLKQLATREVNVCTIEDPIEMVEPAFNQMQVMDNIDLTFADGVKSLLRQDPDIIMVGEIRNLETANMAIQAALTGHLVISTLHTNDAPSAIVRLLDLGVPPYMISATLLGVMAQRLVRTLCPHCKRDTRVDPDVWHHLIHPWKGKQPERIKAPVGCLECRKTGYLGRVGIYEVMPLSQQLKDMVSSAAELSDLRKQAMKEGMRTLRLSGAQKVAAGVTTAEEVMRVAPVVGSY